MKGTKENTEESAIVLTSQSSKGMSLLEVDGYDPELISIETLTVYPKWKPPSGVIYELKADHAFQWLGTSGISWGYHPGRGYNGPAGDNTTAPNHYWAWNNDGVFMRGQLVGTVKIEGNRRGLYYADSLDASKDGDYWWVNNFGETIFLKWNINDSMRGRDYFDNFGEMEFTLVQVHRDTIGV